MRGPSPICAVPTLFYGLTHHPDLQEVDYTHMRVLIAGGRALMEIYGVQERFHVDIRQYGITGGIAGVCVQ